MRIKIGKFWLLVAVLAPVLLAGCGAQPQSALPFGLGPWAVHIQRTNTGWDTDGGLQGILDAPERDRLGGGILTFAFAAHHPIDSNTHAFRQLAKIVMRLLQPDAQELSGDELTQVVRQRLQS